MSWNRVKKMFKRKPKKLQKIEKNGEDDFVLKDFEPGGVTYYPGKEVLPSNMKIHVKFIERVKGKTDTYLWECNGVRLEGKNILEVQDKYARTKGAHNER